MSKMGANPQSAAEAAKIWSSYLEMPSPREAAMELVEPVGIEPTTSSLQS